MAVLALLADAAVASGRTKQRARARLDVLGAGCQLALLVAWFGVAALVAWLGSSLVGPTAILLAVAGALLTAPLAGRASELLRGGVFAHRFGLESLGDEDLHDLTALPDDVRRLVQETRMARSVVEDGGSEPREVLESLFSWIRSVEASTTASRQLCGELGISADPVRELLFADVTRGLDAADLERLSQSRIVHLLERFESALTETTPRPYR